MGSLPRFTVSRQGLGVRTVRKIVGPIVYGVTGSFPRSVGPEVALARSEGAPGRQRGHGSVDHQPDRDARPRPADGLVRAAPRVRVRSQDRPTRLRSKASEAVAGRGGLSERLRCGDLAPLAPYTALGEAVGDYLQTIGIEVARAVDGARSVPPSWREKKLHGSLIGATGAAAMPPPGSSPS